MAIVSTYRASGINVKEWSRITTDIHNEKLSDARNIGAVRLNNSRLNAFSSLKKGDEVDHFSFHVQSRGKVRLGMTDNPELRIELLDKKGKVIADSDANSGHKLENKYIEFNEAGIELEKEKYFLRISRKSLDPKTTEMTYSVQISMGDEYRHDYDTVERAAQGKYDRVQDVMERARASQSSLVLSLQSTTSLLSEGMISFITLTASKKW